MAANSLTMDTTHLHELRLENYRCFRDHVIPLRRRSILTGRNNAGKSTVAEALRILSLVTSRAAHPTLRQPSDASGLPIGSIGMRISLAGIAFDASTLFHHYGDPPAVIKATFTNGCATHVFLTGDGAHATFFKQDGSPARTKGAVLACALPRISILPQIGPLLRDETQLSPDYVERSLDTRNSHLHFRNQLLLHPELVPRFRELVERTWPGVAIQDLEPPSDNLRRSPIQLRIRDRDFVVEVGSVGHGLQMWLQTMWWLTRASESTIAILDEPDVYLHADLQRRLFHTVAAMFPQILVTTHSSEILSEVDHNDVLLVDRSLPRSRFAISLQGVQRFLRELGTMHNISLARLWRARKALLVEGADIDILGRFHRTLHPRSESPLGTLPSASTGGWGGWRKALGAPLLLKNASDETISVYCILDHDYHTPEQVAAVHEEAARVGIRLHVWERKELENYLLVPGAILRALQKQCAGTVLPSIDQITTQMKEIVDSLQQETVESIAGEIQNADRKLQLQTALNRARQQLTLRYSQSGPYCGAGGKEVVARLFDWLQDSCGCSISTGAIADAMLPDEMPAELRSVLAAIESSSAFSPENSGLTLAAKR
jgi:hypothetical protein